MDDVKTIEDRLTGIIIWMGYPDRSSYCKYTMIGGLRLEYDGKPMSDGYKQELRLAIERAVVYKARGGK